MAQFVEAKFVKSAEKLSHCPESLLPEFPLLGRSNVGKSSFINAISNQKHLAKTSNTPGKTRLINYFNFSDKFMIADLPGYGYAKVSKEEQNRWQKNLEEYLLKREQIACLIQFVDGRHDIQKNDIQMRDWVIHNNLPVVTVITKIDCIPKNKITQNIENVKKIWGGKILPFSANNHYYNEEILNFINELSQFR